MKPSKQIVIGLMLLSLAACSTPSQLPPTPQAKPSPEWLEPVPEPKLAGRSNGDLAAWALALREALREANSNLGAVKRWAESL